MQVISSVASWKSKFTWCNFDLLLFWFLSALCNALLWDIATTPRTCSVDGRLITPLTPNDLYIRRAVSPLMTRRNGNNFTGTCRGLIKLSRNLPGSAEKPERPQPGIWTGLLHYTSLGLRGHKQTFRFLSIIILPGSAEKPERPQLGIRHGLLHYTSLGLRGHKQTFRFLSIITYLLPSLLTYSMEKGPSWAAS